MSALPPELAVQVISLRRAASDPKRTCQYHEMVQVECRELRVIILSVHDEAVVVREFIATGAAENVLQSRVARI